ncbi:MAG TPA: phosphotransferase family protein [Acholeplasma sp.]|jgi:thiamine kinase-like enzyme|nr:phosphotransferase family protein [Acholeplasma sp.]
MTDKILNEAKKIFVTDNIKIEERLLGGMSNMTYVISVHDKLYTFRLPGPNAYHFVDRHLEQKNLKIFESLNITNETVYFNCEDGIKVSKYLDGKSLNLVEKSEYPLEDVAMLLKKIHTSKLKAVNDYNPFGRLEQYEQLVLDLGHKLKPEYLKIKKEFLKYKPFLDKQKKTIAHGDAQPSNFIITSRGLKVVDFEFSGNIDPIYDIACFGNNDLEDGLELLKVYYGDELNDDKYFRFYAWRCFQALQWYNVAYFKDVVGMSEELKLDFKKIGNNYLKLANELCKRLENIK